MADDRPRNIGDVLARITDEHAALATLRLLSRAPAYSSNESVLAACLQALGLPTCGEKLRSLLRRLEGDGLLRIRNSEELLVVELTARGGEVGAGLTIVTGVAKPEPDCPY